MLIDNLHIYQMADLINIGIFKIIYTIVIWSHMVGKCPFGGICFTSPSNIWRQIPNSWVMILPTPGKTIGKSPNQWPARPGTSWYLVLGTKHISIFDTFNLGFPKRPLTTESATSWASIGTCWGSIGIIHMGW